MSSTETKHTPWIAKPDTDDDDGSWEVVGRTEGIGFNVLIAYGLTEASARLIAAAPKLLEALKLVVSQIEDYERVNNLAPNPSRQHCWDSVAQAHEIIAETENRPVSSGQDEAKR